MKEKATKPNVYIIESLAFEDEEQDLFETQRISDILRLSGIDNKYFHIRTRAELEYLLDDFKKSDYRYLHISCHGSAEAINMTLGEPITLSELANMLSDKLDLRRLFLSSCHATNDYLAEKIFSAAECHSIIGFNEDVYMDEATVFWSSFYHLMFKLDEKKMTQEHLRKVLTPLKDLFKIPLVYYTRTPTSKRTTWREVKLY